MITAVADSPKGAIHAIPLRAGRLSARVLTLGASVQGLWRQGTAHSLVLGHANPLDYLDNRAYLGAIVGRVANRIAGARMVLDGQVHALDPNEHGQVTLHGGVDGCSRRLWQIVDHGPTHVTLADTLPDGHMGFPGALRLMVTYRLEEDALSVEITATTDATTVCGPAPHLYFNLDGTPTIGAHQMCIPAERMIPVVGGLPIGGPIAVEGGFDLRVATAVPMGLDHHFCLSDTPQPPRMVAQVWGGALALRIDSTEPGLQVFDGTGLPPMQGLDGPIGPRGGLALEPHRWIDAPNQPWAAQVRLDPDQRFFAMTRFVFADAAPAR